MATKSSNSFLFLLIIDLALIATLIGIFGWKIHASKPYFDCCKAKEEKQECKSINFDKFYCPKLKGYISLYALIITFAIGRNITGWFMLAEGPYCNCIGLLVISIIVLILGICLLSIYPKFLDKKGHSDADVAVGTLTTVFNLLMIGFSIFLVVQRYCGKTEWMSRMYQNVSIDSESIKNNHNYKKYQSYKTTTFNLTNK